MEQINGVTIVLPDRGGAAGEVARGPVILDGQLSNGAYTSMVGAMAAGDPGPPLHVHPHTDEAFYVAEGELTFQLGTREVVAHAGSSVFGPRTVVHTAWNSGSGPMRGILLFTPGDAEHVTVPVEPEVVASTT
jgi:quercetin dioxygenase-like cupin family protein